jgi:hypothetical protein
MIADIKQKKYGVEDLLEAGWQIWVQNFKDILMVVLCVYLPINLIRALIPFDFLVNAYGIPGYRIIHFLLNLVGFLYLVSLTIIVDRAVEGQRLPWTDAIKRALPKWGKVVWTELLWMVIIIAGLICFLVPGVIYQNYYIFMVSVVVLRDRSGKSALDYSRSLVSGQWWRIFGIGLFLFLVILIPVLAIHYLFRLVSTNPFWLILPDTLKTVVGSFYAVTLVLFFLNNDYVVHSQKAQNTALPESGELSSKAG